VILITRQIGVKMTSISNDTSEILMLSCCQFTSYSNY